MSDEMLISMAISLVMTTVIYLCVPTILVIRGDEFSKRKIKWIVAINGIICFIFFQTLSTEASINVTPAIFWSTIAYLMLKGKCLKTEDVEDNEELISESATPNATDTPVSTSTQPSEPEICESNMIEQKQLLPEPVRNNDEVPVQQRKSKRKLRIIVNLIILLLILGSAGATVYWAISKKNYYEDKYAQSCEEHTALIINYNDLVAMYDELETNFNGLADEALSVWDDYNSLLDEYLDVVNQYNSLYNAASSLENDYNDLVKKYNSLLDDYDSLVATKKAYDNVKTLTYSGTGGKTIKGINLPAGNYYITWIYSGNKNYNIKFYKSVTSGAYNYESIAIGYTPCEIAQGFTGPIDNGYIVIDVSAGDWKIIIEKAE